MDYHNHTLEIPTSSEIEFHDLTAGLRELVADAGLRHGQLTVSALHTTCTIIVNENEPRLLYDIPETLTRLVPPGAEYRHNDIEARGMPEEPRNAHAHIIAMLLGASQTISVADGELALGTWQSVLFLELDGPRQRRAHIQLLGTS